MRLAFLLPHVRHSGGNRIVLTYASRLAGRGHEVEVLVRETSGRLRAMNRLVGRGVGWLDTGGVKLRWFSELNARMLRRYEACVATSWSEGASLAKACPAAVRQTYLVQHDERLYHGSPTEVAAVLATPSRKAAVSTWLRDMVVRDFGQPCALLINPIDGNQFRPVPTERDSRTVRVLLLDHTYPWKGTAEGAAAVAEIRGRHPEVRLIMFGVRRTKPEVTPDEYHFDPPQGNIPRLYSSCDIYLCPSWDEGFGLPSAEAMACGCALVTYDNGGSRDFAFHERTALVAPHRDTSALTAQLERLVTDAALRHQLAEAGRRFIAEELPSWETQTARLEKLLAGE